MTNPLTFCSWQTMRSTLATVLSLVISVNSVLAEDGFRPLFDGKTLSNWETSEGLPITKGWEVQDGSIFRSSRSDAIYAKGQFGDFELSFEWKLARGGNSGVKYRVAYYPKGVWGNPSWLGCEYQLFDDNKDSDPKQSCGALYALYEPNDKKNVNPPGEFNQSKIVSVGSKIEHWLNGELIVEADTRSDEWKQRLAASKFSQAHCFLANPRGRIQLQDHGHDVWFRNIMIRELGDK